MNAIATQTQVIPIPNRLSFVHPDISPTWYWEMVDRWMVAFGSCDNSTWEEVAPLYAARVELVEAAKRIVRARMVSQPPRRPLWKRIRDWWATRPDALDREMRRWGRS